MLGGNWCILSLISVEYFKFIPPYSRLKSRLFFWSSTLHYFEYTLAVMVHTDHLLGRFKRMPLWNDVLGYQVLLNLLELIFDKCVSFPFVFVHGFNGKATFLLCFVVCRLRRSFDFDDSCFFYLFYFLFCEL